MKKSFLLLLLMTLLPLAGWAVDVEVRPFDASVVWTGAKPTQVQTSWITCTPAVEDNVKTAIAAALTIQDLDDYNVGNHTYKLQKLQNSVEVDQTTYTLMVSGSYSAELTIEKFTGAPAFNTQSLAFVNDDLVYTGEAQALLSGGATATANGFTVPVVYTTKATPAETDWVALADLKETNANTTGYTVYYKVVGTDNYAGSAVQTLDGSKVIAQLNQNFNADGAKPTANTWTYDAQAHDLFTAPTAPVEFGAYQYSLTGADETWYTSEEIAASEELTAAFKGTSNTGNKTVYWRVLATDNYTGFDATALTATIAKATPVIDAEGVINTDWTVYDGNSHALFNKAATATIGETTLENVVSYKVRYKAINSNTWGGWSQSYTNYNQSTFKKKDAGDYQLNIFVGNDDLNSVSYRVNNATPQLTVAQADIPTTAYTEPVAKEVRSIGEAQDLVVAAAWTGETTYGTFQYSLTNNGTDWSTAIPQGTDVQEYTVYWRINPTSQNYKEVAKSYTAKITAKAQVTVTTNANQSFGYGTTPTLEYTATWEAQGEDALNEEALAWNWYTDEACNTPAALNASGYYAVGDYYVKASGLAVTGATYKSQEIVYVPALVKITAGQVNATISGTATYGSLPTFTLTHTSGLSETEAENFNAANNLSKVTVKKDGNVVVGDVAPNAEGLKALDAGEYDLEATATAGDNYAVFVTAGKLTISPNAVAALEVTITAPGDGFVYKAAKWEPENVVVKIGETVLDATDYTITYGDDDHDNIKAGDNAGIVNIAGVGNYAGATASKNFDIKKAELTITADNFTGENAWQYGTTEPTYTITATGWLESGDALAVGGTIAGIEGTLQVKRTSNTSVGLHTGALVPYFKDADGNAIAAPVATNYTLNLTPGDLQVAKAALAIKLKEAVVGTYGDDPADNITADVIQAIANYELDNCELPDANLADVVNVAGVAYEIEAIDNNKYLVGTDYEFTLTGATSTNYTVTISNGTYRVNAADITLYAKDQAINWADEDNTNDEANTTVDDATVAIAAGELKCGDALTDVIASINIAGTKVGNNNITLTAATNANYNITVNKDAEGNDKIGNLTVTGGEGITLGGDNDLQTITDYAGKNVNVTIDFVGTRNGRSLGGVRNWVKENWVTLTLPFDITVAQLSQKLGYAIVNEINPDKTVVNGTSSEFYGKLTMKGAYGEEYLPANKPILVKITDDIANVGTAGKVDFGSQLIVAPTDLTVDAGKGAKFVGTYASKTVTSEDDANIWFMIGGGYDKWAYIMSTSAATWTIAPFEAYIDMSNLPAGARSMTFYFEEIDGTKTAIKSIDADNLNAKQSAEGMYNLNGMKLNSVPTQKGVYIQNGKKIVIK